MANPKIIAKLMAVSAKPDSDGGDPIITVVLKPDYSTDVARLVPHVGQEFTVEFRPMQLDFESVDAEVAHVLVTR